MTAKPERLGRDTLPGVDPPLVPSRDTERLRLGEILAQASVADLTESPLEWVWEYRDVI